MYGNPEFVRLRELASGCLAGQNPACLLAYGTADFSAVLFDELAGFVAVHARERSGNDRCLSLE